MKYKLIKKLPFEGSPEIGYISEEKMVGSELHYWNANWFDPANYPEFWEKAVEKDWEILKISFKRSIKPEIRDVRGYGNGYIESLLKCDNHIHSVKRLSDGEIFSVGDLITYRKRHGFGEWKINSFSLEDNEILAECTRISLWDTYPVKVSEPVTNLKKLIKKPILITEDGVEIFEGDSYWRLIAVLKNQRIFEYLEKVDEKGEFPYRGGGGLFFSTRELAEKYIEENKPMYTKKDMLSFGASMSSRLYPYQCEVYLEQWKKFKKGE